MAILYVSENWNEYREKRLLKEYCNVVFDIFDAGTIEETEVVGEIIRKAFEPIGYTIDIDDFRINIRRNPKDDQPSRLVAVILVDEGIVINLTDQTGD